MLLIWIFEPPTVVDVDDVGERLLALWDVSTDGELLQYFMVDAVPLLMCGEDGDNPVIDNEFIDELSWVIVCRIGDVVMIELCDFGIPALDRTDGVMIELWFGDELFMYRIR